ncbi:MAG: M28 family peptidase [Candidatus Freyarchaeota archaeon]
MGNLILARETIDFLLPEKTSIDAYTDAMSFAEKGLKSASIVAVGSTGFPKYYHTTNDVMENLNYKQVADLVRICLEFIKPG